MKKQLPTREQLEQERADRGAKEMAYDLRMIRVLGSSGIINTDPTHTPITWKATEYFTHTSGVLITEAEARVRVGDCDKGMVFDGWLGVPLPLTPEQKVAHLLRGELSVMRTPDEYISPIPFAGGPPTEVI